MPEVIQNALKDIEAGHKATTTVRALLHDYDVQRRRDNIVQKIRAALDEAHLVTEPDFASVWIDAEVTFVPVPQGQGAATSFGSQSDTQAMYEAGQTIGEPREARQLVRMLKAANLGVVSAAPQDTIQKVVSLMLTNDYSQLPIMVGTHSLKGAVSWKSIGERLVQGIQISTAADAMEAAITLKDTDSLFDATRLIILNDFVFVQSSKDQSITGIVTGTDLSEQFQTLSEPFLLLGEIENQVRNLMRDRFSVDVLRQACSESDPDRKARVTDVADLTFGEYIRVLQVDKNWQGLDIKLDRLTIINELDKVRNIRNDVMHFDTDGIEEDQSQKLRKFSKFLARLERLDRERRK